MALRWTLLTSKFSWKDSILEQSMESDWFILILISFSLFLSLSFSQLITPSLNYEVPYLRWDRIPGFSSARNSLELEGSLFIF